MTSPIVRLRDLHTAYTGAASMDLRVALRSLVASIDVVERLGLRVDRRFSSLDLPNLIQSMETIVALQEVGLNGPEVEATVRDTILLVRDMDHRAARALEGYVQQAAIHASVAAHRATSNEPLDVTQSLRVITAAPTPLNSDAPGVLVAVAPLAGTISDKPYGRISGRALAHPQPDTLQAAPEGATILPEGTLARFQEGDTFFVYAQGARQGDRFNAPNATNNVYAVLVEAQTGGAVVHGPAVLSSDDAHKGMLSDAKMSEEVLTTVQKMVLHHRSIFFLDALMALGLLSIIPLACLTLFHDAFMTAMAIAMGVTVTAMAAQGVSYVVQKVRALRATARHLTTIPERFYNGSSYARVAAFLKRTPQDGPGNPFSIKSLVHKQLGWRIESQRSLLEFGQGMLVADGKHDGINIIPASHVQAAHPDDVQVMRPLLALPAPDPIPFPLDRSKERQAS